MYDADIRSPSRECAQHIPRSIGGIVVDENHFPTNALKGGIESLEEYDKIFPLITCRYYYSQFSYGYKPFLPVENPRSPLASCKCG